MGQVKIIGQDQIRVGFGGRGNRAKMEHAFDLSMQGVEPADQRFRRDDIFKIALGDVTPFVVIAQPVADDQILGAGPFEACQQIGADKSGSTSYEDHRGVLSRRL